MANKDELDIVNEVNYLMDWAFRLNYSDAKSVQIAKDALTKKGLYDKKEARYAANLWLDLKGLGALGEKYIPIES